MVTINSENIESLKVWRILEKGSIDYSISDIPNIDVTLLGLNQKAWELIRGKRDVRKYVEVIKDENNNNVEDLICRFRYEYTIDDSNKVTDFSIFIEFFDFDGNIGLTKKLEKELSRKYLTEFNRVVRQNQIDYLMGAGNGFREDAENFPEPTKSQLIGFANLVDSMWLRYEHEALEYINTGNSALKNIIEGETDAMYRQGLDTVDPESGMTMQQTIIDQITKPV